MNIHNLGRKAHTERKIKTEDRHPKLLRERKWSMMKVHVLIQFSRCGDNTDTDM